MVLLWVAVAGRSRAAGWRSSKLAGTVRGRAIRSLFLGREMMWREAAGALVQSSSSSTRSHHAGRQWRGQAAGGCCCCGSVVRLLFLCSKHGALVSGVRSKQQQWWLTSGIRAHQSLWTTDCVATSLSSSAPVRCLVAIRHPRVSGGTTGGNWLMQSQWDLGKGFPLERRTPMPSASCCCVQTQSTLQSPRPAGHMCCCCCL